MNGTAEEPNFHLKYPVKLKYGLSPKKRELTLVGLGLKAKYVPELHATLKVFVMAIYMDTGKTIQTFY